VARTALKRLGQPEDIAGWWRSWPAPTRAG
jgi:hypothetical protein